MLGKLKGRDRTRYMARQRDNFICQDCGRVWVEGERHFDVHHLNGLCGKKSQSYDAIDELDGLITLCHKCHFNRPDHSGKQIESLRSYSRHKEWFDLKESGWLVVNIARKYKVSSQAIYSGIKKFSTKVD